MQGEAPMWEATVWEATAWEATVVWPPISDVTPTILAAGGNLCGRLQRGRLHGGRLHSNFLEIPFWRP